MILKFYECRAAEELVMHSLTFDALSIGLYLDEQHSAIKSPAWEDVWVHGREGGESYLFPGSFQVP